MVVRPGVPDVTGVIIGDDAAVYYPGQGIGPAMGGDVRKEGDGKGNPVDGVIERNPDVGDVGQDPVHEGFELVSPVGASSIIGKEHTVLIGQILPEDVGLGLAQTDVFLAGHVHDGRAFPDGKVLQLDDLAGLGPLRDLVLGTQVVLHQHIEIGVDPLVPVSTRVLQANETNFAPVGPSRKTGPRALPVADGVGVFGNLHQLKLDFLDRRNLSDDLAQGIEDDLFLNHLLDLDHRLVRLLLPSPRRHLVKLPATGKLEEQENHQQEEDEVPERDGDRLPELLPFATVIPGIHIEGIPNPGTGSGQGDRGMHRLQGSDPGGPLGFFQPDQLEDSRLPFHEPSQPSQAD